MLEQYRLTDKDEILLNRYTTAVIFLSMKGNSNKDKEQLIQTRDALKAEIIAKMKGAANE